MEGTVRVCGGNYERVCGGNCGRDSCHIVHSPLTAPSCVTIPPTRYLGDPEHGEPPG